LAHTIIITLIYHSGIFTLFLHIYLIIYRRYSLVHSGNTAITLDVSQYCQ